MSILSNGTAINKIMDEAGNTIIDLAQIGTKTISSKPAITFTASNDNFFDYTIYGNENAVGVSKNLFDKNNADVTELYQDTSNGNIVKTSGNHTTHSLVVPLSPGKYTFSIYHPTGTTVRNRLRISCFATYPQVDDLPLYTIDTATTDGDIVYSTFTAPPYTAYVMILLWSGSDYTTSLIADVVANNNIMIEHGFEHSNYVAYNSTYCVPLEISGANELTNNITSQEINGLTVTRNYDGSITINGTASASTSFVVKNDGHSVGAALNDNYITIDQARYFISGSPIGSATNKYIMSYRYIGVNDSETSLARVPQGGAILNNLDNGRYKIAPYITVWSGVRCEDVVFKPMLQKIKMVDIPITAPLNRNEKITKQITKVNIPIFIGENTFSIDSTNQPSDITIKGNIEFISNSFTNEIPNYTAYFYNENTLLQTVKNIPYGGTATYTGATPTKSGYVFTGWSPSPTNIQADTACYAQFILEGEIIDDWATISARSIAGTAQNYYSIGDCKQVHLEGTMGTLSLNTDLYVYILGFNHNTTYEPNGITFGGFKTAVADGVVDVALVDSKLGSTSTSGTKYFNMSHKGNYNYGGWKGSDMRYDILGSTNVQPSGYGSTPTTSKVGYDASSTCATNPVTNTLMSCLPSDLRAVMEPMTKYTDNVGNGSDISGNVTSSIDYLPLLSEYEVYGETMYANQYEQNKQAQYAYYIASNLPPNKCNHSNTSDDVSWWCRSPDGSDPRCFCYVIYGGAPDTYFANVSRGVAPIFLVGTPPTTYTVTYYSQDGQTVLSAETVEEGHDCTYSTAPTKESDTDFNYIFAGWSTTTNQSSPTSGATTNIQQDTDLFAAFEKSFKTDTISDSWEDIITACGNGTYSSKYQVGDLKTIDIGSEGPVQMQIVAIDTDVLADSNNTAPITWISKQLLKTDHRMNPSKQSGTSGTGALGGWEACEMRSYLINTIKPLFPSEVRNALKTVKKYSKIYNTSEKAVNNVVSNDDIWIPSMREVNSTGYETSGVTYSTAFPDNASRIKHKVSGSAAWWQLRSADGTNYFRIVGVGGSSGGNFAYSSGGVAVGFCT